MKFFSLMLLASLFFTSSLLAGEFDEIVVGKTTIVFSKEFNLKRTSPITDAVKFFGVSKENGKNCEFYFPLNSAPLSSIIPAGTELVVSDSWVDVVPTFGLFLLMKPNYITTSANPQPIAFACQKELNLAQVKDIFFAFGVEFKK